jgi:O-antigen/teichoic acid export membrane protein
MMQSVAARVLYGVGQIRRFARLMLLEAAINLGLSLALFPALGIAGVALGTAIPNIGMCLYVLLQVCRMLEVEDRELFYRALLKPLLGLACLFAVWSSLSARIATSNWLGLVAVIGSGATIYAILIAAFEFISIQRPRAHASR